MCVCIGACAYIDYIYVHIHNCHVYCMCSFYIAIIYIYIYIYILYILSVISIVNSMTVLNCNDPNILSLISTKGL